MNIITQTLEIREWPELEVGQTIDFGVVIAVGMLPSTSVEEFVHYVDFLHGDKCLRFRFPNDDIIVERITGLLMCNFNATRWNEKPTCTFSLKRRETDYVIMPTPEAEEGQTGEEAQP